MRRTRAPSGRAERAPPAAALSRRRTCWYFPAPATTGKATTSSASPSLPRTACSNPFAAADPAPGERAGAGRARRLIRRASGRPERLPQCDGDDERPAGLGRQEQPLGQAQVTAALGFDDEPAEQGDEHGGPGRAAGAAQEQRPRGVR